MEGSDMRVESMDASKQLIERTLEKSVHIQSQQKTFPVNNKGENTSDNLELTESISEKMLTGIVKEANKALVAAQRELEFSVHEKTKDIIVRVINTETKEVIREIPPEKILDLVASILEMAGLLVDERR
ncbi:MAG: flagellar protein FlaG [Clostridiaceae bacterium]|jgi:flagellar protein FlaG|nr:flagellar protein FlaG [Clostridiaceae bacterium]